MNYINLALAERQGLDESTIARLNGMHEAMRSLKYMWELEPMKSATQLSYLTQCEWLENKMQVAWKFNIDPSRHTHRSFFKLEEDRK